MILRQLFDYDSYTYTYLVADEGSGDAALIDPVLAQIPLYLQLISELGLTLRVALDTHVHADHITALGALRQQTGCATYLGNVGDVGCADNGLKEDLEIHVGHLLLKALYTPGHTDDSYCFYLVDGQQPYVFTGDTLLIRGTGRTDFQNGDANALYHSLHDKLLTLPDHTLVYPGHDYKGWHHSTIAEERAHNPRLQLIDKAQFIEHMQNLKLPTPKWMDVAVPANRSCGKVS